MAIPIHLLNNSSSDETSSDSEDDYMEDEPSESENTNQGSRSSLSSLEREDGGTEEEFFVKYPYLKKLIGNVIAQGFPENDAYEGVKLIGDEKAKELNERGKALFIKELQFYKMKLKLVASVISLIIASI